MTDYYGDKNKYFIAVVKDTSDPNNRVRIRAKGIHPEDDSSSTTGSGSGSGDSGGGGSSDGSSGASGGSTGGSGGNGGGTTGGGSGPAVQAPIEVNDSDVPSPAQWSAKLSPNFTLGQLIVGKDNIRAAKAGQLKPEHVKNLKRLAVNCLEPLKKQFPGMIITSGWRAPIRKAGHSLVNHPGGYAADFQVRGQSPEAIGAWVKANMRGRFTKFEIATRHNHIQIGGGGTLQNPIIFRGKSY